MTYLIGLGVIVGVIAVLFFIRWAWNQIWFLIAAKALLPEEAGEIGFFALSLVVLLYILFCEIAPKVGEAVLGWWG